MQIFSEIIGTFLDSQNSGFQEKMDAEIPAPQILDEILEQYKKEMADAENSLSMAIYEYFSSRKKEESDDYLTKQYKDSFHSWEMLIQYGISRGEFREADAVGIFDLLIFAYQGVRMYSRIMNIDKWIPERITEQIKNMLIIKR